MQQNSKQVQVDLQDLGYETCGRSENEAEREDTSSPGENIWRTFRGDTSNPGRLGEHLEEPLEETPAARVRTSGGTFGGDL